MAGPRRRKGPVLTQRQSKPARLLAQRGNTRGNAPLLRPGRAQCPASGRYAPNEPRRPGTQTMAVKTTSASPDPGQLLPDGRPGSDTALPLKYYPRYFQGPAPKPRHKSRPPLRIRCHRCRH